MVGIVIVSHSQALAHSVVALTALMAPEAQIRAAGGLEDGSFGTSYEKIKQAVCEVDQGDGVAILMDMGSAVMTAEMVVEALNEPLVRLADGPLVEGAVSATMAAVTGGDLETVLQSVREAAQTPKF